MDRLSALSDDLLRRILHLAPSKEAASTSVLSRRWGSLWRSSGAVSLAARVSKEDIHSNDYALARAKADEALFSRQEAFARAAAAALAAAEAPVTRLTLRVATDGDYSSLIQFLRRGRVRGTDADVFGAVLSHHKARHVEDLRVTLAEASDAWALQDREIGWSPISPGIYSLVSLACSETLRVLELAKCDLAPLALPRLATLRLRLCSVQPKHLQALVDAAPELATVHLESVLFTLPPELRYLPRFNYWQPVPESNPDTKESAALCFRFRAVTTLVLALCGRQEQDPQARGRGDGLATPWAIEIDAPRLRSFLYKGQLRRFLLRSAAPDLARVDLHFLRLNYAPQERTCVLFWQFMRNFTDARALKLKLDCATEEIAAVGEASPLHAFPNVERVELEGAHHPASETAAVAVANLLQCCPAVRDLVLRLSTATVPSHSWKRAQYWRPFLGRKDRSDYAKSIDRFTLRRSLKTTMGMEEESRPFLGRKDRSDYAKSIDRFTLPPELEDDDGHGGGKQRRRIR